MSLGKARVVRWLLWGIAGGHVVHALVLRQRRSAVEPLPPAPGSDEGNHDQRPAVFRLRDVEVDDRTLAAATEEMRVSGAQVVDLVPEDLPPESTLRLLQRIDPGRLSENPLYAPGGAGYAVVVHPSVAARLDASGTLELPARADLVQETRRIQRYAPTSTVLRLAPHLPVPPEDATSRWDVLEEQTAEYKPYVAPEPLMPLGRLVQLALLTGGVLVAPVAGAAAVAAWGAKPLLVLGGSPTACLRRPASAVAEAIGELRVGLPRRRSQAAARRDRVAPATPSAEELFEPRRDTCPWCSSEALTPRVDTTDLMQHKPGRFHLDECQACGHVFQNPTLSVRGLGYYYDQFYDGVGAEASESGFGMMLGSNEARIETMARFHEPQAWLDVGAGIGQFCVLARQRWPDARFDGLDLSDSVEEARRRGWVDGAYRGLFPDLAGGLPRSYDVVSMHHYLEHTRDPRAELAAASKVLDPGGYLMVEVPDTASPWSRRVGRFWNCWFQPQHLNFVTCDNLVAALDDAGFDVVSVERGSASTGGDMIMAPVLAASTFGPSPYMPWLPEPSPAEQVKRVVATVVGVVAAAVLLPVELVKEAYLHGPGADKPSNAFRVVARRR